MFLNLIPGVIRQILEFAHQIGKDLTSYMHAARELLIWLISQVTIIYRFKPMETGCRFKYQ